MRKRSKEAVAKTPILHDRGQNLDYLQVAVIRSAGQKRVLPMSTPVAMIALRFPAHRCPVTGNSKPLLLSSTTMLSAQIRKAAEVKKDEALTSIHLMAMYEIISGDKTKLWASHHAGQRELIRLRGPAQFKSPRGRSLYRLIHIIQQFQELYCRRQPVSKPDAAFTTFYPMPHAAKLAELLSEVSKLKRGVTGPTERGKHEIHPGKWDKDAMTLDQRMQSWSDRAPEASLFRSIPSEDSRLRQENGCVVEYPERIWIFNSIQMACARNAFTCGRIHLLQAMLDYRARLATGASILSALPSETNLRQRLQELVGDICATAPFLLGEVNIQGALNIDARRKAVGAYLLLWPLHVAATVADLPAALETWIVDRMFCIGHAVGIKQALVLKSYIGKGIPEDQLH
ncbi:MAG: hypothetical protein Q9191_001811 [Dirinaria sp. TL-2023a]